MTRVGKARHVGVPAVLAVMAVLAGAPGAARAGQPQTDAQAWLQKYAPDSYQIVEMNNQVKALERQRVEAVRAAPPGMAREINLRYAGQEQPIRAKADQWGAVHPAAAAELLALIRAYQSERAARIGRESAGFWDMMAASASHRCTDCFKKPESWYQGFGMGAGR